MQDIIPFNFNDREIRAVTKEDDHWFVLRDVLAAMGSKSRTNDAQASIHEGLGEGYATIVPLQTAGGRQRLTVVNEPAITYLVATSRTEQGRRLNKFIHADVLPALRHTGQYIHEGSGIDRNLQTCTVRYGDLMTAYGKHKKKRFSAQEEKVAVAFSRAMRRAGLPSQFTHKDEELYVTPGLAEVMVDYLNTYTFGQKDRALRLIKERTHD